MITGDNCNKGLSLEDLLNITREEPKQIPEGLMAALSHVGATARIVLSNGTQEVRFYTDIQKANGNPGRWFARIPMGTGTLELSSIASDYAPLTVIEAVRPFALK